MAEEIKVNTEKVAGTAADLETKNSARHQNLLDKQIGVNNLTGAWTGASADAVISAFYQLGCKHFQSYFDNINQYTSFLKNVIAPGYSQTETANISLADYFK